MTALYRATTRHLTSPARTPLPWTQLLLRFWIGDQLVKTAARTNHAEVRNKRAFRTREQA
ncbi:hypothetical protein BI295_23675 [Mycobacterium avium subsp. hominissuis]|uniref:hypothetical protein n=1 Tax=Mycobacterium avium TaxID=1764 RepID=UPI000BB10277|nr:hypothetical protein [Mycobacterium avium]PBD10750.1 hypothetical protein BI295_23675 [Mycobacterium avium subsp. hominissuis]